MPKRKVKQPADMTLADLRHHVIVCERAIVDALNQFQLATTFQPTPEIRVRPDGWREVHLLVRSTKATPK